MKRPQVNVRLSEEEAEALKNACELTGQDQSDIVRACIKAFVERVEEDGEVTRPFAIVSKKLLAASQKKDALLRGEAGAPAGESRSSGLTVPSRRTYPEGDEALGLTQHLPLAAEHGAPSKKSKKHSDG